MKLLKPAFDAGIVMSDTSRMLTFYKDVLGFETLQVLPFPEVGQLHMLTVGESVLRLLAPDTPLPTPQDLDVEIAAVSGIRYLAFMVIDVDDLIDRSRDFGLAVPDPVVTPTLTYTALRDPDGNWIEFQTPTECTP